MAEKYNSILPPLGGVAAVDDLIALQDVSDTAIHPEGKTKGARRDEIFRTEAEVAAVPAVAANTAKNSYPPADAAKLAALNGGHIALERVAGSTYSTVQDLQNLFHSTGLGTGGDITDDADGTITVSAGTGFIRATDSNLADILFADFSAESGANVALADASLNYLYIEYNAGAPQVVATVTQRTDQNTNVFIGTVYRSGTDLHITSKTRILVSDHALQVVKRMKETAPFARVSGGVISAAGTRNFAISSGSWWEGLLSFTTPAVDTSAADTFVYYYSDGAGGWTGVAAQSQIDNLQYDDGSGTLGTVSNNQYGVHWVYQSQDAELYVLYGTLDATISEAQDALPPSSLPPWFAGGHARLIGKIIIQKSASAFTEIESAFTTTFTPSAATNHTDLLNLSADDHTQYHTDARGDARYPAKGTRAEGVIRCHATTPTVEAGSLNLHATTPVVRDGLGTFSMHFVVGLGLSADAYGFDISSHDPTAFYVTKIKARAAGSIQFEVRDANTLALSDACFAVSMKVKG